MKKRNLMVTVLVLCVTASMAMAAVEGFEGASGDYDFYAYPNSEVDVSTEQVYSGAQSLKITIGADNDYARCHLPISPIQLGGISADWMAYMSSASDRDDLAPYVMFIVDGDRNGVYEYGADKDALVIQFEGGSVSTPQDTWLSQGIDSATTYHVVGNRSGLTAGTFSASGTQGTLADLAAIEFDGTDTWGEMDVIAVRIAGGLWPNSGTHISYVDDLTIVPEPATMGLLAVGGLGALLKRKRS